MKKIFYAIFIAVFFVVCIIPSAGMIIFGESQPAANEILALKPQLIRDDGTFNTSINDDITSYIADRMAFRQEIITAYAALKATFTGESASEDVIVGKDGWLFYSRTLDDYLHRNTLSERSINGIARTVKMMQDYAESCGAEFKFTVAPNKNSLYGEYMPDAGAPLDAEKNVDMLKEALEAEGVSYIDLFSVFSGQEDILYHSRDSHWTNRGAALARDVLTGAGTEPSSQSAVSTQSDASTVNENQTPEAGFFSGDYKTVRNHKGDLYEMLYPAGNDLDEDAEFERRFTFGYAGGPDSYYDDSRPPDDSIRIETFCDDASGSLLMFRDSFGNSLYPFMAESFGHAVFSRQFPYRLDMLTASEDPATSLIIEIVERNIPNLAEEAPVMPAPQADTSEAAEALKALEALESLEISGMPAQEVEILCGAEPSDSMAGYTLVRGVYDGSKLSDDVRIFVRVGDVFYEACPVGNTDWTGRTDGKWRPDCCFSAYISGEFGVDEITAVILKSNEEYFGSGSVG